MVKKISEGRWEKVKDNRDIWLAFVIIVVAISYWIVG